MVEKCLSERFPPKFGRVRDHLERAQKYGLHGSAAFNLRAKLRDERSLLSTMGLRDSKRKGNLGESLAMIIV